LSAWNALVDTAELQPGMKVLIHGGSGGVGSIGIQVARHIGAEVYSTCSSANVVAVEDLGATAIPYDSVDFTKAVADCDIVLDTVGGEVHEKSYTVLKKGGCLVYLIAKPFNDISGEFEVETRQAIILNRTENLRQVMDLADLGILIPNVSQSLPLIEFREAFQLAESGNAGGKVVLELRGPNP
jgi:NADPH:quinone reductase-like Zn-dependent oxidoreductase